MDELTLTYNNNIIIKKEELSENIASQGIFSLTLDA
jgi:hypothetical protein